MVLPAHKPLAKNVHVCRAQCFGGVLACYLNTFYLTRAHRYSGDVFMRIVSIWAAVSHMTLAAVPPLTAGGVVGGKGGSSITARSFRHARPVAVAVCLGDGRACVPSTVAVSRSRACAWRAVRAILIGTRTIRTLTVFPEGGNE